MPGFAGRVDIPATISCWTPRDNSRRTDAIGHATLQIEFSEGNACALAPDSVV